MAALDLIPEDQFHAQYKKETAKQQQQQQENESNNPHFWLIKRLEFELSHRIAYVSLCTFFVCLGV
jgi:hypothetical protein